MRGKEIDKTTNIIPQIFACGTKPFAWYTNYNIAIIVLWRSTRSTKSRPVEAWKIFGLFFLSENLRQNLRQVVCSPPKCVNTKKNNTQNRLLLKNVPPGQWLGKSSKSSLYEILKEWVFFVVYMCQYAQFYITPSKSSQKKMHAEFFPLSPGQTFFFCFTFGPFL